VVGVGRAFDAVAGDVDEERRAAQVEGGVRGGAAVRGAAQQALVEIGQPRDVGREERDLGNPGHVGTIGRC
jgi:hypothetical protein